MTYRVILSAIYLFLLSPVIIVCIIAFSGDASFAFPPSHWSMRWFRQFFQNREFVASLFTSVQLALLASSISLVAGLAAAIALKSVRTQEARPLDVFLMSPLFIPRLLIGALLFILFVRWGMQGTFASLLLAHLLIVLPYVVRTISASLDGLDPALVEAARTMGATRVRSFVEVTMPLIKTGIVGALLFGFSVSFTDFYLALFLTSRDTMTLPMQMFYYLEWDQDPLVAAASTAQIGIILVLALLVDRVAGVRKVMGRG